MSRIRLTKIASITSDLDRIAGELESSIPEAALALDRISDHLEGRRGADWAETVKENYKKAIAILEEYKKTKNGILESMEKELLKANPSRKDPDIKKGKTYYPANVDELIGDLNDAMKVPPSDSDQPIKRAIGAIGYRHKVDPIVKQLAENDSDKKIILENMKKIQDLSNDVAKELSPIARKTLPLNPDAGRAVKRNNFTKSEDFLKAVNPDLQDAMKELTGHFSGRVKEIELSGTKGLELLVDEIDSKDLTWLSKNDLFRFIAGNPINTAKIFIKYKGEVPASASKYADKNEKTDEGEIAMTQIGKEMISSLGVSQIEKIETNRGFSVEFMAKSDIVKEY